MKLIKDMIKPSVFVSSLLTFSLIFILSSCFSVKPGASKSGKNLFETFYVGKEGTQYFIKPILFKKNKLKDEILMDFTFRHRDNMNSNAIINYSVQIIENLRVVDSLVIISGSNKIKSSDNKLLFNTKVNKGFKSRFSTEVPLSLLNALFKNNEWEVKLYAKGKEHTFYPSRKYERRIKKLDDNVFVLFE